MRTHATFVAGFDERTAHQRQKKKKHPYGNFSKAEYTHTPFSLRLGHTRGKTIINRFHRPSCRFATLKASFQIFGRGMRTHATYVAGFDERTGISLVLQGLHRRRRGCVSNPILKITDFQGEFDLRIAHHQQKEIGTHFGVPISFCW